MKQDIPKILVVDDEEYICVILSRLLDGEGLKPLTAYDGDTALKMIRSDAPDVLLLDFKMPDMNGMQVLRKAKALDPELPVIMITAHADIHGAVEAMRAGVHDYVAKPFEHHEVIRVVRRALAERDLKKKLKDLSSQLNDSVSLSKVMGPSDPIGRIIAEVNSVAKSDLTVVIMGETGSGKELVARALHNASARARSPFIPVDCGAIPETLLESELFGHEKGAFTGAVFRKAGKFEAAKGGTLLLDEVSNMPIGSQAKLLRVLQEKKVYRVGGNHPLDIDVRLLVASNQDLTNALQSGTFRRDLFYRLNEFVINVPPLRKRQEDIPYLAKRFLEATNIELGKNVQGFSESAIEALLAYDWPGNVRQLRSTIRRAVVLSHDTITEKHLDMKRVPLPGLAFAPQVQGMPWGELSLKQIVRSNTMAVEREIIVHALKYTGGNKAKAARLLKIDYKTIHTKVKQMGISTDIM